MQRLIWTTTNKIRMEGLLTSMLLKIATIEDIRGRSFALFPDFKVHFRSKKTKKGHYGFFLSYSREHRTLAGWTCSVEYPLPDDVIELITELFPYAQPYHRATGLRCYYWLDIDEQDLERAAR